VAHLATARARHPDRPVDPVVAPPPGASPEVRGRWIAAGLALALLVLWESLSRLGLVPAMFVPAPSDVVAALVRSFGSGEMLASIGATMFRVVAGLVLGGSMGLLAGWLMGGSRRLRAVADPFVAAAHPIPKLALLPLLMVFLGIGETSRVVVVAAASFFPMLLNTMAGVRQISTVHFDVARSFGASRRQLLRRVVLPGSLPMVLTGLRLAANIAFLSGIAVEMVAARTGLGAQVWLSWQVLRIDLLYATLVVIAALGVALHVTLRWLARRGAPWLSERESAA
jgi:ABC-type nitrate/sulfonate/bicarbonate transport system permease component